MLRRSEQGHRDRPAPLQQGCRCDQTIAPVVAWPAQENRWTRRPPLSDGISDRTPRRTHQGEAGSACVNRNRVCQSHLPDRQKFTCHVARRMGNAQKSVLASVPSDTRLWTSRLECAHRKRQKTTRNTLTTHWYLINTYWYLSQPIGNFCLPINEWSTHESL